MARRCVRIPTVLGGLAIAILLCTGCPPDNADRGSSASFQPSPATEAGLQAFSAYSAYFDEYRKAQAASNSCDAYYGCDPCGTGVSPPTVNQMGCRILNPAPSPTQPPNPMNPIPAPTTPLIFPGTGQAVLPSQLSTLLQSEFQVLLKRVPASQAAHLQGWTLNITACSDPAQVLWSGHKANAGANGGAICLSPAVIRGVFVQLATNSAASLFGLLVRYDSTDPFSFNGDSGALIAAFSSKEHKQMRPDDIQAVASVVDGAVAGLGESVLPNFKDCMDYLMAREIAQIYIPGGDEGTVASAAASLVRGDGARQIDLAPVTTVFLPSAIGTNGATNWGVNRIGDGQQVLDGMKAVAPTAR